MMCNIDNMNIYRDISVCDMIWYKIIYCWYKLSLHQFIHVIYNMAVLALVVGFPNISGCIINVFEEPKLSNDASNTKQLTNIIYILAICSSLL